MWGDSDQIADPGYGRAYAAAIPGAQFQLIRGTGHLPQLETPGQLLAVVSDFMEATRAWTHEYSVETSAAPEDIWAVLRDLYTGTKLSERGDTIEIHGLFAVGTTLSVSPLGADFVISCTIVELVDGGIYGYRSEFNGGWEAAASLRPNIRHRLLVGTRVVACAAVDHRGVVRYSGVSSVRTCADATNGIETRLSIGRSMDNPATTSADARRD